MAEGLRVWYGADFNKANERLFSTATDPESLAQKGLALREMLSLMIAQRRPSHYLSKGHDELARLTDSHIRLLAQNGVIDAALAEALGEIPVEEPVALRHMPRITMEAFPALMLPVILMGCLYSGVTTPPEAAGIAAAYALLIAAGLYRSLGWGDLYDSLLSSARLSISIGMLIAGALVFNYVVTSENIPATLSVAMKGLDLSPMGFLLLVNLILLVLGAFLEGSTIILIILPVLLPTATALGVDPVHFGVVAVLNIMIGLVTPPYGLLLFMMTRIAGISLAELLREAWPFIVVMIGALALVTVWPGMVLWLPRLAGYTG